MKKFNFLFKPIFFIFSLLFATWLVIKIEQISPSDLGKNPYFSEVPVVYYQSIDEQKQYLQNLFIAYKAGIIDSTKLDEKLTFFLGSPKGTAAK